MQVSDLCQQQVATAGPYFLKNKPLLLKTHDVAYGNTRLARHFLTSKVLLNAPLAEIARHLLGYLVRIVMEIVSQY